MHDIIEEATAFMAACYGVKSIDMLNMSCVHKEVWSRRMRGKILTKAPDLKSLPPTSEAFAENVKRQISGQPSGKQL